MSVALTVRNKRTDVIRVVGDTPQDLWQYATRTYPQHHMSDPKYDRGCWTTKLTPLEGKR